MKQFFFLLSSLLLLNSCSTLESIDSLAKKSDPKYKLKYLNGSTYVASVPFASKSNLDERKKITNEFDYPYSEPLVFDSIGFINVSFDEQTTKTNSKLELIYTWDYSNCRFLVPFLPFGNGIHKRNQCVNRAIEACYKSNMNAVVISPTLNHFRLYRNQ